MNLLERLEVYVKRVEQNSQNNSGDQTLKRFEDLLNRLEKPGQFGSVPT